jgi:hypothetical protein
MRFRTSIAPLLCIALSGWSFYDYDDSISFRHVVQSGVSDQPRARRYQFFVGKALYKQFKEPPYDDTRDLAAGELKKHGLCLHGVVPLANTFQQSGTLGLQFVVECVE